MAATEGRQLLSAASGGLPTASAFWFGASPATAADTVQDAASDQAAEARAQQQANAQQQSEGTVGPDAAAALQPAVSETSQLIPMVPIVPLRPSVAIQQADAPENAQEGDDQHQASDWQQAQQVEGNQAGSTWTARAHAPPATPSTNQDNFFISQGMQCVGTAAASLCFTPSTGSAQQASNPSNNNVDQKQTQTPLPRDSSGIDESSRNDASQPYTIRVNVLRHFDDPVASVASTPDQGNAFGQEKGWLGRVGGLVKGVGEGVWDGAKGMVQGVDSLAQGAYGLATSVDARQQAWNTVAQDAKAVGQFAQTAVTDPGKAAGEVKDAATGAWDQVSTAYQQAAAQGHGAEFIGQAFGQGAVLVGTALVPGGAEAEVAGLAGNAGRVAEVAGDLGKASEVGADMGKAADVSANLGQAGNEGFTATQPVPGDLPGLPIDGPKLPVIMEAKAPSPVKVYADNPDRLQGRALADVEVEMDQLLVQGAGWDKRPSNDGNGIAYRDGKGGLLIINNGYGAGALGGQGDKLHEGAYVKLSAGGQTIRIPLMGNPASTTGGKL